MPWFAKHILHLATPITIFSNGSGDTTYDYVLILCIAVISALATIVWSLLDRRRAHYQTLYQWLRYGVILTLGSQMLSYGIDKVIPLQFGALDFSRLFEPLGEMSPFSLLWNFMAASRPYTIAVGSIELLGGILLFLPRFTTLASLISLASMANVFVLNMCYDVPVKLFSLHLGLMAAFLLLPEAPRLLNVFVSNRPAIPPLHAPLSRNPRIHRVAFILQVVLGVLLLSTMTFLSLRTYSRLEADRAVHGPLYGVWNIDELNVTGDPAGSLFTPKLLQEMKIPAAKDRWQRLVFQNPERAFIQLANGTLDFVKSNVDLKSNSLSLSDSDDVTWKCVFSLQTSDPRQMQLQGTVNGLSVTAKLHREDETRFILITRGFHWINEYPFSR